MTLRLAKAVLIVLSLALSGCAAYQPIETTPEGILGNIEPGDTIRVVTRSRDDLQLLVTRIDDAEIRGLIEGDGEAVRLSFDAITVLEIHRFSLRRTLLGVVLPVVVGVVIACNNDDCRTESVLDADL